jgi:hypothetical protein
LRSQGPYPYSFIEEWWGESLNPDLQERIEAAPRSHLASFMHDLHLRSDRLMSIPPRQEGVLRPLLRPVRGARDILTAGSLSMAMNVLLYAHEVIIDSSFLFSDSPRRIPKATAQLLAIKPLADTDVIHIAAIDSRSRHPSLLGGGNIEAGLIAALKSNPGLYETLGGLFTRSSARS